MDNDPIIIGYIDEIYDCIIQEPYVKFLCQTLDGKLLFEEIIMIDNIYVKQLMFCTMNMLVLKLERNHLKEMCMTVPSRLIITW